jgi:hypothetical protein
MHEHLLSFFFRRGGLPKNKCHDDDRTRHSTIAAYVCANSSYNADRGANSVAPSNYDGSNDVNSRANDANHNFIDNFDGKRANNDHCSIYGDGDASNNSR